MVIIFCRYASIFPHAQILYCTIIHEFGKKGDLRSALAAFEASKHKLSGPNMYAYRTAIDVCGLCGDYIKSRYIYEVLSFEIVVFEANFSFLFFSARYWTIL